MIPILPLVSPGNILETRFLAFRGCGYLCLVWSPYCLSFIVFASTVGGGWGRFCGGTGALLSGVVGVPIKYDPFLHVTPAWMPAVLHPDRLCLLLKIKGGQIIFPVIIQGAIWTAYLHTRNFAALYLQFPLFFNSLSVQVMSSRDLFVFAVSYHVILFLSFILFLFCPSSLFFSVFWPLYILRYGVCVRVINILPKINSLMKYWALSLLNGGMSCHVFQLWMSSISLFKWSMASRN